LFSAHMTQHELLMVVAAPLLVLGRPLIPALWALPMRWRKTLGGVSRSRSFAAGWQTISGPAAAWIIHAIALWVWHLPGPYQATVTSDAMHTLQHASFFGTALLFWWSLIHARSARLSYGASVLYVFTTAMHTGGLGALLTFAASPWYPHYETTAPLWGLTALEDQQLAGLIMWVPAGVTYLIAALMLITEWMRESERRAVRWRASIAGAASVVSVVLLSACGLGTDEQTFAKAAALTGGDPKAGALKIGQYGCSSCHTIPGVRGANQQVGPPLTGIAGRMYIAGILPNNPENMVRWITNPPANDPKTAMPNLGVNTKDATDIAAYLYTLK
jgi:cytochrome c oxidase assembly factor CtaG/cytochrome c2